MSSKKSRGSTCCVVGCSNNSSNTKNTSFYLFSTISHKKVQREKWINAVKRINPDGSTWQPKKHTRICSQHFIGNKKSDHPQSPSFIPKIFPKIYNKRNKESSNSCALERFKRTLKQVTNKSENRETELNKSRNPNNDNMILEQREQVEEISNDSSSDSHQKDQSTQVDFFDQPGTSFTFICDFNKNAQTAEVGVQACIPLASKNFFVNKRMKKFKDQSCGTNEIDDPITIGVDFTDPIEKKTFKNNIHTQQSNQLADNIEEKNKSFFNGFYSITNEQELLDLAGVKFDTFNLFLKILKDNKTTSGHKITLENRLLVFIIKMKCGLSFSAISVFFATPRTTVSRICYSILRRLAPACKNYVTWPSRNVVQAMMPDDFKQFYPNCRVIIDCTEMRVEQPSAIEDGVYLYSHYKKGFTTKILVGCTPNGYISLVSKCHGGRTTDSQITINSGLLELLEPGDVVLADKGFPEIKTIIDASGKGALVVTPPFLHNEFSAEEVAETYKVSQHRIHIERIMQRLRVYQILNKLPSCLLSCCDDIIYMCCALVNLQPPILKESDNDCTADVVNKG